MSAKKFLADKGIFNLDTKKRYNEVVFWIEEYASLQKNNPTDIGDILAFAEYFRSNFEYCDRNANGAIYTWVDLAKRGQPAMHVSQIFDNWKSIKD